MAVDEDAEPPTRTEQTRLDSAALFGRLETGDADAREGLVRLHLPLVEHCARRFRNRGEPFEDLVQVGTIGLLLAFSFLILRGLFIAAEAPTLFTRLLAGSITLSIFTYVFVNMGMVSGILPVVGIPLPFVSYGGTAMVTMGLALGMLMSISRSRRLMQS